MSNKPKRWTWEEIKQIKPGFMDDPESCFITNEPLINWQDKAIVKLRDALEFYASDEVEASAGMEFKGSEYNGDFGDVARTALKECFGEEK